MSTVAVFLLLGGGAAVAAKQLGKNSVGSKQLKKNAVTASDIKKNAVTTAKIKKDAVTGAKVNESTLGTVPSANSAGVASSIVPPEPVRLVGTPGQPPFEGGSGNFPTEGVPIGYNPTGFYKDHEGIVHLQGAVKVGPGAVIFTLPPGYRPPPNTLEPFVGYGTEEPSILFVVGGGVNYEGIREGMVVSTGDEAILSGISFRAGS
jgi:hypothetical protein